MVTVVKYLEMLHNVIQDALVHAEYFSLEISHDSMQDSSHAYKYDIGLSINFNKHKVMVFNITQCSDVNNKMNK